MGASSQVGRLCRAHPPMHALEESPEVRYRLLHSSGRGHDCLRGWHFEAWWLWWWRSWLGAGGLEG